MMSDMLNHQQSSSTQYNPLLRASYLQKPTLTQRNLDFLVTQTSERRTVYSAVVHR